MTKLAVVGLGYVGTVTAACFAARGNRVIGIESNPAKVALLRDGISPVTEPGLAELVRDGVANGRLTVSQTIEESVAECDITFICVGTPAARDGDVDLRALQNVLRDIGSVLRDCQRPHTVAVRSTVPPGTTTGIVTKLLCETSGRNLGRELSLLFNPEFLREGTAVSDFYNPPYVVIGHSEMSSPHTLRELWSGLNIEASIYVTKTEEAELLKYACNAFHALKVVFANEIGAICEQLDIDAQSLMHLFVQDRQLNISERYLKPGFAYGGSCLPKDVQALNVLAARLGLSVPLLHTIESSNNHHLARAISGILQTDARRVAVIGLGFKTGTDDVRNSPAVLLCEQLIGKGIKVCIFDRYIVPQFLLGRNREFLQSRLPHIVSLFKSSVEECVADAEVVVICNSDPEVAGALDKSRSHPAVIDLTTGSVRPLSIAASSVA